MMVIEWSFGIVMGCEELEVRTIKAEIGMMMNWVAGGGASGASTVGDSRML